MLTWTPRSRWWCPRRCAAGTPPSWRSARPRWRRTGQPIRSQHYPPTNHSSPCTRSSARTPPPPPPWPCRGRACPRRPCPWTAPCPSSTLDHNDGADNWQWSNPLLLQLGAAVSGVVQQLQTVESLCLVRAEEWPGPGSRGNTGLVPAAGTGYVHGGGRGGHAMGQIMEKNHSNVNCSHCNLQ